MVPGQGAKGKKTKEGGSSHEPQSLSYNSHFSEGSGWRARSRLIEVLG